MAIDGVRHRLPARTVLGVPGDRGGAAAQRAAHRGRAGRGRRGQGRAGPARRPGRGRSTSAAGSAGRSSTGWSTRSSAACTPVAPTACRCARRCRRWPPRWTGTAASSIAAARSVVDAAPPDAGPAFAALDGGMGVLPEAVASASGADVRLRLPMRRIERTTGGGFRLVGGPVPDPVTIAADAVVVAAPAGKAAGLLEGLAPWAAHELAAMEYASVGIVTLAFPASALAGLTRLRAAGADRGGRRRGQGGDVLVPQVAAPGRPRRGDRAGLGRPAPRGAGAAPRRHRAGQAGAGPAHRAGRDPVRAGRAPGDPVGRRPAAVRAWSPGAGPPHPGRRGQGAGPGGVRGRLRRGRRAGLHPLRVRRGGPGRRSTCENRCVAVDGKRGA